MWIDFCKVCQLNALYMYNVCTDQGAYTCTSGSPFTFCKCRSLCYLCITNIFNLQNITQRSSWCTHPQKDLVHVINGFELLFKKFHPLKKKLKNLN